MEKTKLYNGVPAVLIEGQWVVLSANFSEIVTIPEFDINNNMIYTSFPEGEVKR